MVSLIVMRKNRIETETQHELPAIFLIMKPRMMDHDTVGIEKGKSKSYLKS
jgi:hypothetical protein